MGGKGTLITIIVVFGLLLGGIASCSDSSSSSSGRKWSDLSEVEKQNAKWAYEAKQAIDKYGY